MNYPVQTLLRAQTRGARQRPRRFNRQGSRENRTLPVERIINQRVVRAVDNPITHRSTAGTTSSTRFGGFFRVPEIRSHSYPQGPWRLTTRGVLAPGAEPQCLASTVAATGLTAPFGTGDSFD